MTSRRTGSSGAAIRKGGRQTATSLARIAALCMALESLDAHAALPAWQGPAMHYVAVNSRLTDVLNDVAKAGGVQMEISRDVKGSVNGVLEQVPSDVFRTLTEAWGLSWYYDGQAIHVSTSADVKTRSIPITPMTRDAVAALLHGLDLDDPHLPVRYSDTTIKVVGPSRYIEAVADAIAKARQQTPVGMQLDQTDIRVFPLRYAQAQDITYSTGGRQQVIPGVASLLRRLMENSSIPLPVAADQRAQSDTSRASRGGVPPLPTLPGLGEVRPIPIDPVMTDTPLPQLPAVRRNIVADTRTNSVVVYDLAGMMPNYERVIATLDQPQDLVEISAVVIDVSSDAVRELGIRWGAGASSNRPETPPYGQGLAALPGVLPPMAAASAGINLTTLVGNSAYYLYQQIHAMESNGRARILSRPQVLTLNNAEAVLSSRNSVYVRVAGNQDANLFNVDTGLTLKVTPTVERGGSQSNRVLLSVQIEDGAFDTSATVDGIPRVNNNSIITQAVVTDGDSLLIGGYQYEHTQSNTSKVPLLGDIPFVGALFRDNRTSVQRMERLVLITPRIKPLTAVQPTLPTAVDLPVSASMATIVRADRDAPVQPPLPPDTSPLPAGFRPDLKTLMEDAR